MNKASLATIVRFLISGGINTGATFALYWLLLLWLDYRFAYAISFICGIALSYVLSTRFVFRTSFSWAKVVMFPLVYLVTYAAGACVLDLSVRRLGVPAHLAPFVSICVTLPLTFLLSRFVLTRLSPRAASNL
ncbi:TPA: GtrA family protein [Stenotrophomonas maltophilia]